MKKLIVVSFMAILILFTGVKVFAYAMVCPMCESGTLYIHTELPTCIRDGLETYECTHCDFSSCKSILRAYGHERGPGDSSEETTHCIRCDKYLGVKVNDGIKTGHHFQPMSKKMIGFMDKLNEYR